MVSIHQLSFMLIMTAIFFVTGNIALFDSNIYAEQQQRQPHSVTSVCNEDYPCYTTFCSDGQPCQTFSSNEPSVTQLDADDTVEQITEPGNNLAPLQEVPVEQPQEEETAIIMEPVNVGPLEGSSTAPLQVEDSAGEIGQDDAFRVDDQINYLEPNPYEGLPAQDGQAQEEEDQDRDEEVIINQEDVIGDEEKYLSSNNEAYSSGDEHEKFEQVLYGTPEGVEVETETRGIEIFVDYVEFFDDQQNLVTENPERHYNGGPLELQRGGTITLNFADCHTECNQPDAVRSVYLVDGNVDDNDILKDTVEDDQKIIFEPIDQSSFQFRVPDGVTGSHTFNKLVIETDQTDEIDAFYIGEAVEIA